MGFPTESQTIGAFNYFSKPISMLGYQKEVTDFKVKLKNFPKSIST